MKPKLLSINQIYSSLWGVITRFPLAVITVIIAAATSMYLIEQNYSDMKDMEPWIKLLLTSSLALPFFVAVTFITETSDFDNGRKKVFHVVAFIIVFLYYWHFEEKLNLIDYQRTFILNFAIHLLVAYSPYLKTYNENGFWQFNKTLFLRFLLAALYSGVLYSGLSIALLAIDNLFDVKINEKIYFHLWIFIAVIFNSIFFLAGIPQNVRQLDADTSYPKGLKVFTQFVLLPLVTVYLLILYVYGFKILVSWELPRGWVSFLVMCFSVSGIFSLLMIHPVKNNEQNKWMSIYSRWYYILLFPLLILLAVAIYVRVDNYGITENRYLLITLAIWLFFTIVYFLFSKKKIIQWIPVSLSIVAVLSIFGPWGAFAVSENSQVERLEKLLTEYNILQNGKIVPAKDTISFKAEAEIASIILYLDQSHGYKKIQSWFEKDLEVLFAEKDSIYGYVYKPEIVLEEMGLKNNYGWSESDDEYFQKNFNYFAANESNIVISGYDEMIPINVYMQSNPNDEVKYINLSSDTLTFIFNSEKDSYVIKTKDGKQLTKFSMNSFVNEIREKVGAQRIAYEYNIPEKYMYKNIDTETYRFKLFVRSIYGENKQDTIKINGFDASLLIAYPKDVRGN